MANKIIEHADLRRLSTFALPAHAHRLIRLESTDDITDLSLGDQPVLILGEGSNTVFMKDWPGTILLNRIQGYESRVDGDAVHLKVGAGVSWHPLVRHCLDQGWYGLENLIMIPGSVGAAPIQNIGAYGVELSSCIRGVQAWDFVAQQYHYFDHSECAFGYRDSLFKNANAQNLLITEVHFELSRTFTPQTTYPSLQSALATRTGPDDLSPRQLAATIMRLRRHRLPDPRRLANVGSFFKNPMVAEDQHHLIKQDWPMLPSWPHRLHNEAQAYKLSAAWMIEQTGLKGHRVGDAAVYRHHALVLINLGHANADDLQSLIELIQERVRQEFGVQLDPEPRLIR